MRTFLIVIVFACCHVYGDGWTITEGGLSPDKKLAVALLPQKAEETDDTVFLIDHRKARVIGPLEEISSSGGTWGTAATNVHCIWSNDSTILVVNFRTGRMMWSSQIYRIRNHRAIPITFPVHKTHPKGKLIEGLGNTTNPGSEVSLSADGTILKRVWGITPDQNVDYSKHGLKGFEGDLLFHYRFDQRGQLQLHNITVPAP